MMPRIEKMPPDRYDRLQRVMLQAINEGHSPEGAINIACRAIGIAPPTVFEEVEIVVVPYEWS